MKTEIMKLANRIIMLLECCNDGDFVDEVCANISCATPFYNEDGEEIEWEE